MTEVLNIFVEVDFHECCQIKYFAVPNFHELPEKLQNLKTWFLKIVMQKLDGMNIIIQLKSQNHENVFETTSTAVLHGLSVQMLKEMVRSGRT